MRPVPLKEGHVVPLAELPKTGIVPAERDQRLARLVTYNTDAIPTEDELAAMREVQEEAFAENERRQLGRTSIHAA